MAWVWAWLVVVLLRLIQPRACLLVAVQGARPVGYPEAHPEAHPVVCPVVCPEAAAARYPEWVAVEQVAVEQVAVVPLPHHLCRREYR